MPDVNQFQGEYKDKLNVIAVHVPRSEKDLNMDEIKQVAEEHDMTHPISVHNGRMLADAFENQYVPAYYVCDKEGKLRHFQAGGEGLKMFTKKVNRALGEAVK